jgi:hypothetical protein
MEHFMRAQGLLDNAELPENRILPCFAGLLVPPFRVQQSLSSRRISIEKCVARTLRLAP